MAKPKLARSAALHHRITAFGVLFVTLVACFEPITAFVLALVASALLSVM
ncbi:hypothetical protein N9W21_08345 [Shewanella sp.]|nr:hypothetical protein [Shewanella sp.]